MDRECHIKDIRIVLKDDKNVYQSGDCVNGEVLLSLSGSLSVEQLRVKLLCVAEVGWQDCALIKHDSSQFKTSFTYHEVYHQMPEEYSDRYLTDGFNRVSFELTLPESGPGTFEGIHGSIIYLIEAFIEQHHESTMTEIRVEVEAPIKDNLLLSLGATTHKELSFYNLGSGQIKMHAYVLKKGYRRGEEIQLICIIVNNSTACVRPRACLCQTQVYMVDDRHKTVESVLTEYGLGDKVDHEERRMSFIHLTVPEGIPLSLKSDNICVKYLIHVTLDIPHALNLHLNLPIIVTNIYALSKA